VKKIRREPVIRWDDIDQPLQHRAALNFRKAADYRVMRMVKHPGLSEFHSRAEFWHAALAEADPSVIAYVPQPFRLRLGHARYTPDCYVRYGDRQIVLEIKPEKHIATVEKIALNRFFSTVGMGFDVISNEAIEARAVEAENWLNIVRTLTLARHVDTRSTESKILKQAPIIGEEGALLHELVTVTADEQQWYECVAIYRLIHRGILAAELTDEPLNWGTRVYHGKNYLA